MNNEALILSYEGWDSQTKSLFAELAESPSLQQKFLNDPDAVLADRFHPGPAVAHRPVSMENRLFFQILSDPEVLAMRDPESPSRRKSRTSMDLMNSVLAKYGDRIAGVPAETLLTPGYNVDTTVEAKASLATRVDTDVEAIVKSVVALELRLETDVALALRTEARANLEIVAELKSHVGAATNAELKTHLATAIEAELKTRLATAIETELKTHVAVAAAAKAVVKTATAVSTALRGTVEANTEVEFKVAALATARSEIAAEVEAELEIEAELDIDTDVDLDTEADIDTELRLDTESGIDTDLRLEAEIGLDAEAGGIEPFRRKAHGKSLSRMDVQKLASFIASRPVLAHLLLNDNAGASVQRGAQ